MVHLQIRVIVTVQERKLTTVLNMGSERDIARWEPIMQSALCVSVALQAVLCCACMACIQGQPFAGAQWSVHCNRWERLDDVIMGGQSSSTLKATEDGAALFSGDLIIEGGGFCGARTKVGSTYTSPTGSPWRHRAISQEPSCHCCRAKLDMRACSRACRQDLHLLQMI